MQQRLERGEAAALSELYDRFAPLVHRLAHRVLDDEQAAHHVTEQVFVHVWEDPGAYDPRHGSLRGHLARLARQQAVAELRHRHRGDGPSAARQQAQLRAAASAARAEYLHTFLPPPLRAALDHTRDHRDCRRAAARLGITEQQLRHRLRLGLLLLATAAPRPDADDRHVPDAGPPRTPPDPGEAR